MDWDLRTEQLLVIVLLTPTNALALLHSAALAKNAHVLKAQEDTRGKALAMQSETQG